MNTTPVEPSNAAAARLRKEVQLKFGKNTTVARPFLFWMPLALAAALVLIASSFFIYSQRHLTKFSAGVAQTSCHIESNQTQPCSPSMDTRQTADNQVEKLDTKSVSPTSSFADVGDVHPLQKDAP